MSLAHLLAQQARRQPGAPAILHGTALHASYLDWAARSAGLAKRLRAAMKIRIPFCAGLADNPAMMASASLPRIVRARGSENTLPPSNN